MDYLCSCCSNCGLSCTTIEISTKQIIPNNLFAKCPSLQKCDCKEPKIVLNPYNQHKNDRLHFEEYNDSRCDCWRIEWKDPENENWYVIHETLCTQCNKD